MGDDGSPTMSDDEGTMTYTDQPSYAPHPNQMPPVQQKGSNGLATAGFVLGLVGVLGSWIPILNILSIILGLIGAVLAGVGLAKSKRVNAGKGLAIAGIVLSLLAIVLAILVNTVFVSAVDDAVDEATSTKVDTKGGKASGKGSDAEVGTTRDNPAPLGSAISGDDWTVTVNSVKPVAKDSMGQAPASGMTLLSINLTATYTGNDPQGDSPWSSITFVSPDGTTTDTTSGSTLFIADNGFDSLKTVFEGASVKGDELLEVPSDTWKDGVLAVSPAVFSDDTFVAVQ